MAINGECNNGGGKATTSRCLKATIAACAAWSWISAGSASSRRCTARASSIRSISRWEIPDEAIAMDRQGRREAHKPDADRQELHALDLMRTPILRRDLESWRGKPSAAEELKKFDVTALAGVPALINVTRTSRAATARLYANVVAITKLPKGMEKRAACSMARSSTTPTQLRGITCPNGSRRRFRSR
jgi:hypothetical protein